MSSYVMFKGGPSIRGDQSEVEFAAEAYVKTKIDQGESVVMLGCSPGVQAAMQTIADLYRGRGRLLLEVDAE